MQCIEMNANDEVGRAVADKGQNRDKPTKESKMFAASLRAWRLYKCLTQDELAEKAGVSKSSISMAERAFGHYPPKEITQVKLATALGISANDLQQMPPTSGVSMLLPTKPPQEVGRAVQRVNPSAFNTKEMGAMVLPSKWILGSTDTPGDLTFLVVNDAVMQPTIKVGDVAILEPVGTVAPGLYLIGRREKTGVVPIGIRRVTSATTGKPVIACDNERYDQAVDDEASAIAVLSKVAFIIRAIEPE